MVGNIVIVALTHWRTPVLTVGQVTKVASSGTQAGYETIHFDVLDEIYGEEDRIRKSYISVTKAYKRYRIYPMDRASAVLWESKCNLPITNR